jgi:ATP-binding cassette subfamily C (CFTR/MRP) protein 10
MGCLYRSALLRRHQGDDEAGDPGDVSTLMAVDTGRAVNLAISVHAMLSLPLQIGVAMYLLYTQVGGWVGEWDG